MTASDLSFCALCVVRRIRLLALIVGVHTHGFLLDVRSSDASTWSGAHLSNLCSEHDVTECE